MSDYPVVLITGASSGIGQATARLFGRAGYRLVLAARRFERMQSLASEIQAAGGQALPVATDVGKLDEIQHVVQSTLEHFNRIDILFNNAGFGCLDWLENLDPVKDIEALLRVNLLGMVQMTRSVLPHMIAQRSGHIINMASVAGLVGTPTYTVYAASKFAVRGFSEALRREVGVWGVHVSVIYPGSVETEFGLHTRVRRKTRVMTPGALRLNADQVARVVLRVVRRPRRAVIIPWVLRLGVLANAMFPGIADRLIEQRFVKPERGL